MAQHDYDINSSDSISGLQFRADVNAVLSAIKSSNSGATAPTAYIAGTLWLDTSTTPHILKKRNTANTGWDTIRIEDALGTAIASAATTTVGTYSGGNTVHITGTTTITSLGVSTTGTTRTLIFDGALTITHNATSLILLGGANILTVAGSIANFVCENGALGYWRCTAISHSAVSMAELLYISTLTSDAQTQLNAKAPLASPTFTGVPAAPTASLGTNTTQIATTAFVLANPAISVGSTIQQVRYETGTLATGAVNIIPFDNTTPQITEGTQLMSLAITPIQATSKLMIDVTFIFGCTNARILAALFRDSGVNAIGSMMGYAPTNPNTFTFSKEVVAGSTALTTFYFRAGSSGASTYTFNGESGAAYLNSTIVSSITITEIAQ